MSRTRLTDYVVIRDKREKVGYGWTFTKSKYFDRKRPPRCIDMELGTLTTGDYTLQGYEDIVTIERKDGFVELWNNYGHRERFEKEMDRMSSFKYAYILIESSITPEVLELSPPQYKTGVPGKALIKWIITLGMKYNVQILPVGRCGKQMAQLIFEEVIRAETK